METKKYQVSKEFGEKWLGALRSGDYTQTKSKLKDDCGYCCLGVACTINGIPDHVMYGSAYPKIDWLPQVMNVEPIDEKELFLMVANKNDCNWSFPEIADWIEANVEFI